MNSLLKSIAEGAANTGEFIAELSDRGMKSVNGLVSSLPVFGALTAQSDAAVEFDETHYLLIPIVGSQTYALYTKRVLPPEVGVENSLPKQRVFHLPDKSSVKKLEDLVVQDLVHQKSDTVDSSSDLADALDNFADRIDKETQKISGGLLLIGGAVALVNPVVGVGIALKSLFPSITSQLAKSGTDFFSRKLRRRSKEAANHQLEKESKKEVSQLKPIIYTNSIIQSLDAISTNPNSEFDPIFDQTNWVDAYDPSYYYELTREAISEVYQSQPIHFDSLDPRYVTWINSLTTNA